MHRASVRRERLIVLVSQQQPDIVFSCAYYHNGSVKTHDDDTEIPFVRGGEQLYEPDEVMSW